MNYELRIMNYELRIMNYALFKVKEQLSLQFADGLQEVAQVVVGIMVIGTAFEYARRLIGEVTPQIANLRDTPRVVVQLADARQRSRLLQEGAVDKPETRAASAYLLQHTYQLRQVELSAPFTHLLLPRPDTP